MAIVGSITHITSKALTNITDTTQKHTFWKTNFNMPVENIFGNLTTWTRYNGPVTHGSSGTSFSLSGFSPGFETVVFSSIWDWENTGPDPVTVSASLYSKWVDTDNSTTLVQGANGASVSHLVAAGDWYEYLFAVNIGVAGWEVDENSTYYTKSSATGTHAITEVSTGIVYSNVPSVTQLGASTPGFIWVEGNNLCFVNANRWKHTIVGTQVSTTPGTSKAGFMWIDTSNDLHWVGATSGYDYKIPWKVQQFASYFSNGPTNEVNAGTAKAGFIWVDSEFGDTHLAYIGYNGYKWLCGAGDDPYA